MLKFKNKLLKNFSQRYKKIRAHKTLIPALLLIILIPAVVVLAYNLAFWGKIYPGIAIAGVSVGGLTPQEAIDVLTKNVKVPQNIVLASAEQNFEIPLSEVGANYDFIESVRASYDLTRTGNILYDVQRRFEVLVSHKNLGLSFSVDEQKLESALSGIAGAVATEPVYPSVKLVGQEVVVDKGKAGSELDMLALRLKVGENLSFAKGDSVVIPLKPVDPTITEGEASVLRERAVALLKKSLVINFEFQSFSYKGEGLFPFLGTKGGINQDFVLEVVSKIALQVEREAENPVFIFEEGRVKEFEPSKEGVSVKRDEFSALIAEKVAALEGEDGALTLEVPVVTSQPKIATGDVNNLGIKELIGRGVSRFRGSIPNRVHNISLASSRYKGVLIAPGETLSFNKILGDVSGLTGFKQAYVIMEGRTVLGDGGGVCQVSSTLFRAALNAGLPIVERTAHAYRVGYYEQDSAPGFDATIYAPSPDLKINNDTPGHILVQTSVDTKTSTLVFEIYGTKDGRVASVTKPVVSAQVAPPEDLYVDDPTLPAGTVKQIDYKAWGAKVSFNYLVTRNGEEIYKRTFVSNYRPWQAVYLRGTAPAQ